jgi:hypothetical protein
MVESEARGLSLDVKRELLRHVVATVAYRCGIAVSDTPENFAEFRVNETSRSPGGFWPISAICSKAHSIWSRTIGELKSLIEEELRKPL